MRIIDKINQCASEGKTFYSFEYFPPKTDAGVENLYERFDRMARLEPLFIDVTWGAGGSTSELTLEICSKVQQYFGLEVMMHLTCTNMHRDKLIEALDRAKAAGIKNILALRGDPPHGTQEREQLEGDFAYAVDLIRFIRQRYGDWFGIGCAGYPESHLEAKSAEEDLRHLKSKIDAGADFVITQLFYDTSIFLDFVKKCRAIGIQCPIIPGIMPLQNYNGFKRMTGFCKTHVPQRILDDLEPIKDDDAAVKAYGIQLGVEMCRELLQNGIPGLHFYTLNLERSVTKIMEGLRLTTPEVSKRQLPWRRSQVEGRVTEDVRPIFWANRPKSYLARTSAWDDFPNGRWGDSRSPGYGELNDYHLFFPHGKNKDRKKMWGESPRSPQDVADVFVNFLSGKIDLLPWCESTVHLETNLIAPQLIELNKRGFLTINSQPRVNGADSTDPNIGWGGPGGYVYQKAYLECFCSLSLLKKLVKLAKQHPSITFHAVNSRGQSFTNSRSRTPNAVTWGVFPDKEIIQPTVVDPQSFMVWKDEAFHLWLAEWQSIYEPGTPSHSLIRQLHDDLFLINVVDNNFVSGDLLGFFIAVTEQPEVTEELNMPQVSFNHYRNGSSSSSPPNLSPSSTSASPSASAAALPTN